jgi:4-hydroxyphenylpyruvate dioxygenase
MTPIQTLSPGFDHVEFAVAEMSSHAARLTKMGFEQVGSRKLTSRGIESALYAQGQVRIVLTQPISGQEQLAAQERTTAFQKVHGDGICVLAMLVADARKAYEDTIARGAVSAMAPMTYEGAQGRVTRAEIFTPCDLRYAFIERHGPKSEQDPALFDEGLVADRMRSPSPQGLVRIDHLTNNVSMGEMAKWVKYYQDNFGFFVSRHFDIRTGRTGLISDVIESQDGFIKVPINEATEAASQVQEFITRFKGPGVQHLALETTGIISTLRGFRKEGFKFLTVPHSYYEAVPTRVPGVSENLAELEELGILLDGEQEGYLMQIFSEELVGPFFVELIERKGNKGFGEGNFRALFEAIERDQIKRGVLKE